MKAKKDPLDFASNIGSIAAWVMVIAGFILYFIYRFAGEAPKDGIDAVFMIALGYFFVVQGQFYWYKQRLMRLEREVEALRGKDRPE